MHALLSSIWCMHYYGWKDWPIVTSTSKYSLVHTEIGTSDQMITCSCCWEPLQHLDKHPSRDSQQIQLHIQAILVAQSYSCACFHTSQLLQPFAGHQRTPDSIQPNQMSYSTAQAMNTQNKWGDRVKNSYEQNKNNNVEMSESLQLTMLFLTPKCDTTVQTRSTHSQQHVQTPVLHSEILTAMNSFT